MSTPQTQTASTKATDKKAAPPPAADTKAPTATPAPKADAAPASAAPTATPAAEGGTAAAAATDAEPKERQKVYIVVGEVREFKNPGEAEKFLNKDPEAPKGDYVVIKGKKVERKAKVSLR